jgi:ribosomal protein S18 acetylase RimI-like enzyme
LALPGVQLVETEALKPQADPEAVVLGPADHAEMAALVARTRPGPWGRRTPEFGRYLGIRCDGVLAAMAGERMRPAGWTEISAVCTDPAFRGHGLAGRLVRAVADGIRARGERSLLHAASGNPGAIRMYEGLGYAERRSMTFFALRRD